MERRLDWALAHQQIVNERKTNLHDLIEISVAQIQILYMND